MNFLGVVSSQAIRGALGVGENELPDTVFTDTQFETELQLSIEGWLPDTIAEVCTNAAAGATGYPAKLKLLRLHAQYQGALIISPHANLGFASSLADGQNEFTRSKDALDKLLATLAARAGAYKEDLLEDYEETLPERTSFFGSAEPSYDPVTDETS